MKNAHAKENDIATAAQFSVTPGGPVQLTRGSGVPGYPGVQVRNEGGGTVSRQNIAVNLPPGKGLHFESEAGTNYLLSVYDSEGQVTNYIGTCHLTGRPSIS
jgi:hypothetical protein